MLGSMDSALPPKSERPISLRRPLRQLSLGQDPLPASPLISTRNLVPGLSDSVVKLDRLGKGATSNVFRAVHAATLKMVALKEVTVSTDADRRAVRTEMSALSTQRSPLLTSTFTTELTSCPRIVDFYGSVVRENGNACIAVEYVAGGSLGSWLDSGCQCPEAWIAHIAYQALEALDFVHSGKRVHRDVKPANLLITRRGDLKLADFGAAGVENSSRMVGTQRFMAPERLKGRRATAQSDLWSFGLSLATAVLGDDFMAQASNEFEQLDLAGRARITLSKATTLSRELRDFLHQCLSRDPARRPALRDLMKHEFLDQRHDWATKCPEVTLAMEDRKRRQREAATALSTDAVLNALCQARADDNLTSSRIDPATAADLAYELGVTAKSLVRNVDRRTRELTLEREGGLAGVSDSGGNEEGCSPGKGRGRRLGGGIAGDARGRRRRRNRALSRSGNEEPEAVCGTAKAIELGSALGSDSLRFGSVGPVVDSDASLSPARSPLTEASEHEPVQLRGAAPMATVGGSSPNANHHPVMTPRNRVTTADQRAEAGPPPSASFGGRVSSRRRSKRVVEVPSAVKLTPHKRRGERKSSQMKRNGSACVADAARTSRDRRERDGSRKIQHEGRREMEAGIPPEALATAGANPDRSHEHDVAERNYSKAAVEDPTAAGCRKSQRKAREEPLPVTSRALPSRTDVSLRSGRNAFQVADEMKAQISVRDRVHRWRVYPNCFSGREAVQWMLDESYASSVIEAEKLGNEIMKASVFQHIQNSHRFEDSKVYYQFTDGETPPPPARGGKGLRQIARVVRGHVARKFVHMGDGSTSGRGTGSTRNGFNSDTAKGAKGANSHRGTRSRERSTRGAGASTTTEETKGSLRKQPPKLPKSSGIDRSKKRRNCRQTRASQSQLRRFSSSMSTATVPETPY